MLIVNVLYLNLEKYFFLFFFNIYKLYTPQKEVIEY